MNKKTNDKNESEPSSVILGRYKLETTTLFSPIQHSAHSTNKMCNMSFKNANKTGPSKVGAPLKAQKAKSLEEMLRVAFGDLA